MRVIKSETHMKPGYRNLNTDLSNTRCLSTQQISPVVSQSVLLSSLKYRVLLGHVKLNRCLLEGRGFGDVPGCLSAR